MFKESRNTTSGGCTRFADIFPINADLRLKTTLCPYGFATDLNWSGVFPQKYIPRPKSSFRDCIYLFIYLGCYIACTGHIMTGSSKGSGNQYIQLVRVLYCKLPTNGKQLPAFPLEAVLGTEPGLRGGRLECYHSATVAPFREFRQQWLTKLPVPNHPLSCLIT